MKTYSKDEQNDLKNRLWNKYYFPKLELLEKELDLLLSNKKHKITNDLEKTFSLQFEFDSPLEFTYGCYPSYEYRIGWWNTAYINIQTSLDQDNLQNTMESFFSDYDTSYEKIDHYYWNLVSNLHKKLFSTCWKQAKSKNKSELLAFICVHEGYPGMNCDTFKIMTEAESEKFIKSYQLKVLNRRFKNTDIVFDLLDKIKNEIDIVNSFSKLVNILNVKGKFKQIAYYAVKELIANSSSFRYSQIRNEILKLYHETIIVERKHEISGCIELFEENIGIFEKIANESEDVNKKLALKIIELIKN